MELREVLKTAIAVAIVVVRGRGSKMCVPFAIALFVALGARPAVAVSPADSAAAATVIALESPCEGARPGVSE